MYYKLTDQNNRTTNNTIWGENVTHKAAHRGKKLCTNQVIHVYAHPLLAVFMNPAHANIQNPKLWECKTSKPVANDGTKIGVKSCTTLKEIPPPEVSTIQRIAFGILCAKKVWDNKAWNHWADKWLSGGDRSKQAAYAAYTAAYAAAYAAYTAAYTAYTAASDPAYAAYTAAYTAAYAAAYDTDYAAAYTAASSLKLNLVAIAIKAMGVK
jgi:hypothetical protein